MKKLIKSILMLAVISTSIISCASTPQKTAQSQIETPKDMPKETTVYYVEPENWVRPDYVNGFSTKGYSDEQIKAWQFFAERALFFESAIKDYGMSLKVLDGFDNLYVEDGKLSPDYIRLYVKMLNNYINKAYWSYCNFDKLKEVYFEDIYGSKEELLKKGYVINETMFYYPAHDGKYWDGENDWRVGHWGLMDRDYYNEHVKYQFYQLASFKYGFPNGSYFGKNYNPGDFVKEIYVVNNLQGPELVKDMDLEKAKEAKVIIFMKNNFWYDCTCTDYKKISKFYSELNEDAKKKGEKKTILIGQSNDTHDCIGFNSNYPFYIRNHIVDDTVPYEEQIYEKNDYLDVIVIGENSENYVRYGYDERWITYHIIGDDIACFRIVDKTFREPDFDPSYVEGVGYLPDIWLEKQEDAHILIDHILCEVFNHSLDKRLGIEH